MKKPIIVKNEKGTFFNLSFLNPLNWFKKELEVEMPYRYAEIIYSQEAVEKGVFDEFQKKIRLIVNGKVIGEPRDYSQEEVIAIKKIYKIPILDRTEEEEEEYSFSKLPALEGELIETIKGT